MGGVSLPSNIRFNIPEEMLHELAQASAYADDLWLAFPAYSSEDNSLSSPE